MSTSSDHITLDSTVSSPDAKSTDTIVNNNNPTSTTSSPHTPSPPNTPCAVGKTNIKKTTSPTLLSPNTRNSSNAMSTSSPPSVCVNSSPIIVEKVIRRSENSKRANLLRKRIEFAQMKIRNGWTDKTFQEIQHSYNLSHPYKENILQPLSTLSYINKPTTSIKKHTPTRQPDQVADHGPNQKNTNINTKLLAVGSKGPSNSTYKRSSQHHYTPVSSPRPRFSSGSSTDSWVSTSIPSTTYNTLQPSKTALLSTNNQHPHHQHNDTTSNFLLTPDASPKTMKSQKISPNPFYYKTVIGGGSIANHGKAVNHGGFNSTLNSPFNNNNLQQQQFSKARYSHSPFAGNYYGVNNKRSVRSVSSDDEAAALILLDFKKRKMM